MGLSAALATAGRALEVFSAGVQVAGQNVANANNPNYIREQLVVKTNDPYRQGNLIFGTGVQATGLKQQIDKYLEVRLHSASSDAAGSAARDSIYKELEAALQELGDSDLSTSLDNFLGTINDVSNQPESDAFRQIAIRSGETFASDIQSLRGRLDTLRSAQTTKVDDLTSEANRLIDDIAKLNSQIGKLESGGLLESEAGALRSQRYGALNRLAEIIPVRAVEQNNGSFNVFLGGDYLVLADQKQHLEVAPVVDRGIQIVDVRVEKSHTPIAGSGGELNGVINGRDEILGGFVDQLDDYVSKVIFEFNKIHSSGEGIDGFSNVTATSQVTDTNAPLNNAGLTFTPQHGNFDVKITNTATGITSTTSIAVDLDGIGADSSLEDLRAALDGITNLSATISTDGTLELTAATGYEIRFGNDTSGTLAALGINTFFTGTDSSNIGVNSNILNNSKLFAAGKGGGPGDSSNAVQLARFVDQPVEAFGGLNLNEQYDRMVSQLAQDSASESAISQGFSGYKESLLNQRSQFSGVSLDEEAIKMMELQHSYQASARIITLVDELFTTLVNI